MKDPNDDYISTLTPKEKKEMKKKYNNIVSDELVENFF